MLTTTSRSFPLRGRSRKSAAVASKTKTGNDSSAILQLQRQAGNAAVASLLSHGAPITISRYESGEHAQTGDQTKNVTVNGVRMDQGVLVALGDFYEKPEDMYSAPVPELQKLVSLVERDRDAYKGVPGAKVVTDAEWSDATKLRKKRDQYLELAARNDTHFSPTSDGHAGSKGDFEAEWKKLHTQALLKVVQSVASGKPGVPEEAVVINGLAAHFLTDAFSAGHLVNKDEAMNLAKEKWKAQKFNGAIFKESTFTKTVGSSVLATPSVAAAMANKELKMLAWGPVTPSRFSEFIYQMADSKPELFFNSFAKLVHDKLNQAILGADSKLEVTNKRGDGPWMLSGDKTLASSADTLKYMQAAVAQSVANLEKIAALSVTPASLDPFLNAVWDYTPHPTDAGKKKLDAVVSSFVDPTKDETVKAFVALTVSQVDLLITELTAQGYMRDKPPDVQVPVERGPKF